MMGNVKMYLQTKKGKILLSFLAVFFLISIRFLYFGFEYYPQLDDYIQHYNYTRYGSLPYVISKFGLFGARPIAGILDITLWSWLWPCAIIGVLLLCAMYAVAALVFFKIFNKLFGASKFFIVIFALLPLGIEGMYWMSASTRIIPGVMLASLSLYWFVEFMETGCWRHFIFAFTCQFLTFGFYEQTAVLSCALNVFVSFVYITKSKKRWLFSFTCVASAALYFGITALSGPSALYDGRTSIILPTSTYYFKTFIPELLSQIKSSFLGGGYYTLVNGFVRGIKQVANDTALMYCIFVLAGCVLLWHFTAFDQNNEGKTILPIVIGVLLIVAPLVPFFIIANPWFSFRGTVASFAGIALVADVLIRWITNNHKKAIAYISATVAFVFCICSVSEIADYKATNEADTRVVSTLSKIADDHTYGDKVAVLNVDPMYLEENNCIFHEHIIGVTESSWALTGAIRWYNDNHNEGITYVPITFQKDPIYKKWEYGTKTIGAMDGVYFYDYNRNSINRLKVEAINNTFELYFENGEKLGTVVEENECGRFFEE